MLQTTILLQAGIHRGGSIFYSVVVADIGIRKVIRKVGHKMSNAVG